MTMRPGVAVLVGEELERLRAVADLRQTGTPPEERFDRITRLARSVFGVPIAMINIVGEHQTFTKSPQLPGLPAYRWREASFCDVAIETSDLLVVRDATEDPRFSMREAVTGPEQMRFYAGRPLVSESGHRVGALCIVDTRPRHFDDEERALLEQMARLVEDEFRHPPEGVASSA
jgi:sigma-B regulation protein RsbU (phosphoserine phosphatase)